MSRNKSNDRPERTTVVRLRPPRKCPICGKDATQADYPFCSRRCAEIDLNRWLSGAYAIPAVEGKASPERGDDEE
jgi:uncharacterized protein